MISILNFGSLNIDHVYHVSAFVRPGETISSLRYDRIPGGKGLNQSVALARAGAHVFHAGKVGEDGAFLVDLLEHDGVDTTWVARDGSITGHACIQVDEQGQNCIVLHGGANQEITPDDVAAVLDAFHPGDWLVLQNEISCLPEIVEAASRRDMVIVLNPSPITPDLLALDLSSVSYLLLNETEGKDLTGETEPEAITAALLSRYPCLKIVLTLGGDGAQYADAQSRLAVPACHVKAVDTTAAGDTFTGYFIAAVSSGEPVRQAMEKATQAAAIAVSRPGASVSIPYSRELEDFRQAFAE